MDMRRLTYIFPALLLLSLVFLGAKCPGIPDTKKIRLRVPVEDRVELHFLARGSINAKSGSEVISTESIRKDLDDLDIDVNDVDTLRVSKITFCVTKIDPEESPDRTMTGVDVTVTRTDTGGSALLVDNFSAVVKDHLGIETAAPIVAGGIDWINDLLEEVLATLKSPTDKDFEVIGAAEGVSEPTEHETNFDWKVTIYFYISGDLEIETFDF